jgi:hypothetical protein
MILIDCHNSTFAVQQPSGKIDTYLRATLSVIEVIICYYFTSAWSNDSNRVRTLIP